MIVSRLLGSVSTNENKNRGLMTQDGTILEEMSWGETRRERANKGLKWWNEMRSDDREWG